MSLHQQELHVVAEQAADWMLRLKMSEDPKLHAALLAWLKASPLHVREFLLASCVDDVFQNLDAGRKVDVESLLARAAANSNVIPIDDRLPEPRRYEEPRRRVGKALGAAASIAATAVLGLVGWFTYFGADRPHTYTTRVGEQRMFELNDGSVVTLNTQSSVQVRFDRTTRNIYLDEGQALFQVKHDATRPFRVHSNATVITAIGTQFDVRRYLDRTTVAVVEGTVQVSPVIPTALTDAAEATIPFETTKITAGEGITVSANGRVDRPEHVDTAASTAWQHQRLVFVDTTLEEIAREFNRYNAKPHLRVASDEVKHRMFTGSFNARSPESFVAYISQETDLLAERHDDEVVIRQRNPEH